ncbi:MAG: class I SAM-dependent methyltransferase [Bryobacteraceae bacterium]
MTNQPLAQATAAPTPQVFDDLNTFLDWDRDFYLPAEERFYDNAVQRMIELLGVPPGATVLDAGCGVGTHSIRAARLGFNIRALDFSRPALAEGQRRALQEGLAGRITFEYGDLTDLHLPDDSFPYVFSWGVVIHIPAAEKALDSLARILKPGGRLALYITNSTAFDFKLEALARSVRGKRRLVMEKHPLGEGYWYRERRGEIWVWQMNIKAVTDHLESRGLVRLQRLPGMLTEMHTRCPRLLRRLIVAGNGAYFRWGLPAGPAEANLLLFEKPAEE